MTSSTVAARPVPWIVGGSVAACLAALAATGLPTDLDRWLTDDVVAHLAVDKKRIGANLRFIVIREVGLCEPADVPLTEVRRILRLVRRP